MALTVPSGRVQTAAVIATLQAAGLTVGDGSGAGLSGKYAVVYADLGVPDGPMGDRFADLDQTVFVHSCGSSAEQAQWVGDKTRAALLAGALSIDGRAVLYVDHVTSQPVQRDDDISPSVFYAVDQYTVATTPA